MEPLTIYIIRHAEKPVGKKGDAGALLGVDPDGTHDSHNLIVRGWQRAGGLAQLFAKDPLGTPMRYGISEPQTIFATSFVAPAPGDQDEADGGDDSKSQRPQSTVLPLVEKLQPKGVPFITKYAEGEEQKVAKHASELSGSVLIAWHHGHIPALATDIGGTGIGIPAHWDSARFDLIWVLTRDAAGAWTFQQLPQYVLAGDAAV